MSIAMQLPKPSRMAMVGLGRHQRDVLALFRAHVEMWGRSPRNMDLARMLQVPRETIYQAMQALARRGLLLHRGNGWWELPGQPMHEGAKAAEMRRRLKLADEPRWPWRLTTKSGAVLRRVDAVLHREDWP